MRVFACYSRRAGVLLFTRSVGFTSARCTDKAVRVCRQWNKDKFIEFGNVLQVGGSFFFELCTKRPALKSLVACGWLQTKHGCDRHKVVRLRFLRRVSNLLAEMKQCAVQVGPA